MKKVIIILVLFFFNLGVVNAEKLEVEFDRCVDGDTASLIIDGEIRKVRFLAVDTPETVHPTKGEEDGGKTASDFTCNSLTNAKKIEIEYDPKSDKVDKYDRELVWIYIDEVLFQETLIRNGYAEVAYIYGKYMYVDDLCKIQESAMVEKQGIWYDGKREVGYCKTKDNKTTKKTTKKKTTTKSSSVVDLVSDEKYEEALTILLEDYPFVEAIIILVVIVIVVKFGNKKKKKH